MTRTNKDYYAGVVSTLIGGADKLRVWVANISVHYILFALAVFAINLLILFDIVCSLFIIAGFFVV